MSYKVGQVLYVILRKEASVYPMQVVEEITKKTLDGEVTTYMVRAGSDPNKVLPINDIDGEVFDSAEKAKKTLIDRVSSSINQRVEQAVLKAKEWYPTGFESAIDDPLSIIKKTALDAQVSAAKPKRGCQEPAPAAPPGAPRPETAALAAELAAEAEETVMMEVPDGNGGFMKAKVKGVKLPPGLS